MQQQAGLAVTLRLYDLGDALVLDYTLSDSLECGLVDHMKDHGRLVAADRMHDLIAGSLDRHAHDNLEKEKPPGSSMQGVAV